MTLAPHHAFDLCLRYFAQRFRCASAIFARCSVDNCRVPFDFAAVFGAADAPPRARAHRARCAAAMRARAAALIRRPPPDLGAACCVLSGAFAGEPFTPSASLIACNRPSNSAFSRSNPSRNDIYCLIRSIFIPITSNFRSSKLQIAIAPSAN